MELSKIETQVVLFENDEKSLNYKFEPHGKNLNSTTIASIEYDRELFLQNEIIGQRPEVGSVYYKHPYKHNCYINSNLEDFYFMNEKMELFSNIVKLLGGKRFSGTAEIDEIETLESNLNGEIKYNVVELDANAKKNENARLNSKLILTVDFNKEDELVEFDRVMSYEKVKEIIKQNNLSAETSLLGLVESRNPHIGNSNTKQILRTELTSEFNSVVGYAAKLKLMEDVFSLNMAFDKQVSKIKKVNLLLEIEF